MFSELSTRSKFLDLYYPNSEVKDYSNSAAEVKEARCPTIQNGEAALPPAIMPIPAAAGPSRRPAFQTRPLGGHLSPPTPSTSTSPVVLARPRVAGGPNSNPSPSPSPMPNPPMIVMNFLLVVFMSLPNAHQVKRFTDHIIELNLKVLRFGQVLLLAALVYMPFKCPAGGILFWGVPPAISVME
eukprot:gene24126-9704_t